MVCDGLRTAVEFRLSRKRLLEAFVMDMRGMVGDMETSGGAGQGATTVGTKPSCRSNGWCEFGVNYWSAAATTSAGDDDKAVTQAVLQHNRSVRSLIDMANRWIASDAGRRVVRCGATHASPSHSLDVEQCVSSRLVSCLLFDARVWCLACLGCTSLLTHSASTCTVTAGCSGRIKLVAADCFDHSPVKCVRAAAAAAIGAGDEIVAVSSAAIIDAVRCCCHQHSSHS